MKPAKVEPPPKKKAPDIVVLGEMVEDLRCPLTSYELEERGQSLAKAHDDLVAERGHADLVKKDLKTREQRIVDEISRLSAIVRNRAEPRPVKVLKTADYDKGIYYEVRTDTGEVLYNSTRQLRETERQRTLSLGGDDLHQAAKDSLANAVAEATRPTIDPDREKKAMPPVPPTAAEKKAQEQAELERQANAILAADHMRDEPAGDDGPTEE